MAKKNKGNKKVTKPVAQVETPVVKTEEVKVDPPVVEVEEVVVEQPVETKPVEEPKNVTPPKKEKAKEVAVEVVEPAVKPVTIASAMGKLADGERISVNSRILLMSMIKEAYLDHKNSGVIPPEISNSMTEYFNFEAMNSIIACMNQFKGDMEGSGIKVKPEIFESIQNTFATYLDVKLIGNQTSDGQMQIDFKETVDKASPEAKEVIASEAKVEKVQSVPQFEDGKTEEEHVSKIRSIFSMKLGMGNNLLNGIEYGKKAFNMPSANTADVIAKIISKFGTQPCILINSFEQAIYGSLIKHSNPFALHAWMGNILNIDNEEEISEIVKVFLADKLKNQAKITEKDCKKEYLVPFSNLFSEFNDKIIDKLVEDFESDEQKGIKLHVPKLMIDPIKKNDIMPFIEKRYGPVAEGTGKDIARKQIKDKLTMIAKLYERPLSSFERYIEKSNLA